MGLTHKILAFTGLIVVVLVATSVAFTTFQADRLADEAIDRGLEETRHVWATFQADRFDKLRLGVRVLANDPAFKAAMETDPDTIADMLRERGRDLGADVFIATDADGVVLARSDRAGDFGEDLSEDPLVLVPLEEGQGSATLWSQGDRLYHALSVPMQTGPIFFGVLIAGYSIDEAVAHQIHRLTRSDIAFLTHGGGGPARLVVSSLGPREAALGEALAGQAATAAPDDGTFELRLSGERFVGIRTPLKAASGQELGSVVMLRGVAGEMAAYVRFRNTLVLASLVVMVLSLGLAYAGAARITGPVRRLVDLVARARDGAYTGAVAVDSSDEIGVLARSFNSLLVELREKEQLVAFLHAGRRTGAFDDETPTSQFTVGGDTLALPATRPKRSPLAKGELFAERYTILGTIGKGGMGVVYRAEDRQLDEIVALKVLRTEALEKDPTLLERFKQELKLARRITHRNVLRTHDFGEFAGTAYISMVFLEGITLKELVTRRRALPLGVGLRIAKQICQGLEAAHLEGVVHRDIKPQNMLILPETGDIKIMDFGIARVSAVTPSDSGLTVAGMVMGTPHYMPPEQAQGRPADFRSDIYSLGVVLFETFTGQIPFDGESAISTVAMHMREPPPAPRSLNTQIPPELESLILRCLEKDPERRFQTVGHLLAELASLSSRVEAGAA